MSGMVTLGGTALTAVALALLGLAVYAYVGYPLIVRSLVGLKPLSGPADPPADDQLPRLSVLMAARNEAYVVRQRLENLLEQDYPPEKVEILFVSDASDDGTDEIVAAMDDPRIRRFRLEQRGGKTAAINSIGAEATGDVIVHTDANVFFVPGCLRALAVEFRHPEVGVVVGEFKLTNADTPDISYGEGAYWRFETWTKRRESERGLMAVANGSVYAIRRELWQPLPPRVSGDAAEPLIAARRGFRTINADQAIAFERAAQTFGEELQRKARIISQQVTCARWLGLRGLPPRIAWAYVSHKLLRYAVPLMLGGALVASAAAAPFFRPAAWLAGLIAAPYVLSPLGFLPAPAPLARVTKLLRYLVMINAASVLGIWWGLSGRGLAAWDTPESTRRLAEAATTGRAPGPRAPSP